MRTQTILAITLLLTLVASKKLKTSANTEAQSETQYLSTKMPSPSDGPEALYTLLNEYRKSQANIYNDLNKEGKYLETLAEAEVDYMISKTKFGQFDNFDTNSDKFSSYTEVVCELAENHDGKAYQAAYALWIQDESIKKEFKNEYTLADANCQGYGNGWICALLLATPLKQ